MLLCEVKGKYIVIIIVYIKFGFETVSSEVWGYNSVLLLCEVKGKEVQWYVEKQEYILNAMNSVIDTKQRRNWDYILEILAKEWKREETD